MKTGSPPQRRRTEPARHNRAGSTPPPALAQGLREAAALQQAGRVDAAADLLYKLMQQSPDDPRLQRFLGGVEMSRGGFDKAVGLFLAAVNRNPRSAEAQNDLGKALAARGWLD